MADRTSAGGTALRLIAAVFTPLDGRGEVALDRIAEQASELRERGVDGAFVCGTTGEGPSLSTGERLAVAERWLQAAGRLEVLVHVGHASLREAQTLAEAAGRSGAKAIACCAPFYLKPAGGEALVDFCAEVAAAAPGTPFLYYHIPALTHVSPSMPSFIELARARIPSFAGVKFTSPDLVEMARSVERAGPDVAILSGPDELLLQALTVGVRGAVGSTYTFFAPQYREMFSAYLAGDRATAERVQRRLRRLIDVGSAHGGLPAFKAMTGWLGVDCGPCRLPARTLDAGGVAALRRDIEAAGVGDLLAGRTASTVD